MATIPFSAEDAGGEIYDLVLRADPVPTADELGALLDGAIGPAPGGRHIGDRLVAGGEGALALGLRPGVLVSWGPPRTVIPPAAVAQLRVVGGPVAGRVWPLAPGTKAVGRSAECGVQIDDRSVSAHHARLTVAAATVTIEDLGSRNGVGVEGALISGPTAVPADAMVQLGDSFVAWTPAGERVASLESAPDGMQAFNRPPRILAAEPPMVVVFPEAPASREHSRFPMVAVVAPLLMGIAMAAVLGRPEFLAFTLLSPVMAGANFLSQRRQSSRSHRDAVRRYEAGLASARATLAAATTSERDRRRAMSPDAGAVAERAARPLAQLWERRRSHPDFLELRLGLADLPSEVDIRGTPPIGVGSPKLHAVPATLPLREVGVVGIAGPIEPTTHLARWLVAQMAVLHSPRDLRLVLLTRPDRAADWGWVRWLPHIQSPDGGAAPLLGNDDATTRRCVAELVGLIEARQRSQGGNQGPKVDPTEIVVVLDGAQSLRTITGMPKILQEGPSVGIRAICLEHDERRLPEECLAVVAFDDRDEVHARVTRSLGTAVEEILADQVSASWALDVARALAPILDTSRDDEGGVALPSAVRLLDLLALEPLSPGAISARWAAATGTAAAPIGVAASGPFVLDLPEHGPHGLVAGTTGSGKSELLQTIVGSLSAANRPDRLSFVLVDYKGGSAFRDCARLPHTVGLVTDLDGHLTERALTSLTAELRRREAIFNDAAVKNISDYWRWQTSAEGRTASVPRLVIVIDEFASLADELPEFVRGLVGIAQRGRSLGVNLILATQRPSGVVSPEIRANTNLRVALRMTDPAESADVIDIADAAMIPHGLAGRAIARIGHGAYTTFQAARVGGRRQVTSVGTRQLVAVPWAEVGRPRAHPAPAGADDGDGTDLAALVDAMRDAAGLLRIPVPPSPWLPPLPEVILQSEIDRPVGDHTVAPAVFAVQDVPDQQARRPVALDLDHGGHLLIVGSPRSGRSTALRTILGTIAATSSAKDVHIYAIDCGNGALAPLAQLPHCGAVVGRDQLERADRLIAKLLAETARRQQVIGDSGFADLAEQRAGSAPAARLPYIVVAIDRWEGFTAAFEDVDGGRLILDAVRLLREAPSAGVRVVIAGDRSALSGRLAAAVEDRILLRMNDRSDYGLAGLNARKLPETIPAGRAFRADNAGEMQVAVLSPDHSGQGQTAALDAIAEAAQQRDVELDPSSRPDPVAVLPTRIRLDALRPVAAAVAHPLSAAFAVGGDRLDTVTIDLLDDGPAFVIGGPARTGRSTALRTLAEGYLAGGCELVVFAPRRSPLSGLADRARVRVIEGTGTAEADVLESLEATSGPLVAMIDDAELLNDAPAGAALATMLRGARDRGWGLVLAGTTDEMKAGFRGVVPEARKGKAGLLLAPGPGDGELLGLRLPRSVAFSGPAGRGILVQRGSTTLVQVALPDEAS